VGTGALVTEERQLRRGSGSVAWLRQIVDQLLCSGAVRRTLGNARPASTGMNPRPFGPAGAGTSKKVVRPIRCDLDQTRDVVPGDPDFFDASGLCMNS